MSNLTWAAAAARVAGSIAGRSQPDALGAARDAISETLQDWDSRRDWRYTQVVAPNIALTTGDFDLPTHFKKPYVAYLASGKPLFYVERANWHRSFPGSLTTASTPRFYTLFDGDSTGQGNVFPPPASADTLVVLYYRSTVYTGADESFLDIPARWEGYILAGARSNLTLSKQAGGKSASWESRYERGIAHAKQDDLRLPDQFLSFVPVSAAPNLYNPNSTWESVVGA